MLDSVFLVIKLFFEKYTGEIITGLIISSIGLILAYFKRPTVDFKLSTPAISANFSSFQQTDGELLKLDLSNHGHLIAFNIQLFLINTNKIELWKSVIIEKGETRDLIMKVADKYGRFRQLPGPHIKSVDVENSNHLTLKIHYEDQFERKYETTYLIKVIPNHQRKFTLSYPTMGKIKLLKSTNNLLFLKEKMKPEVGTV